MLNHLLPSESLKVENPSRMFKGVPTDGPTNFISPHACGTFKGCIRKRKREMRGRGERKRRREMLPCVFLE